MGVQKFRKENKNKSQKMGLEYYKRFGKDRFHVDQIWSGKREANAHADDVRRKGSNARVVKRMVKWPTENKKTPTYVVYKSRTQKKKKV